MVTTIFGVVAALLGITASILAIRAHLRGSAKILIPPHTSDVGGRHLQMSGVIPRRAKGSAYWIAIQPSDTSRGAGDWWPQGGALELDPAGRWQRRGTLGRDGAAGERDIGKSYTIALVEVPRAVHTVFEDAAKRGERLSMPLQCNILHSVEVKRVSYGK